MRPVEAEVVLGWRDWALKAVVREEIAEVPVVEVRAGEGRRSRIWDSWVGFRREVSARNSSSCSGEGGLLVDLIAFKEMFERQLERGKGRGGDGTVRSGLFSVSGS